MMKLRYILYIGMVLAAVACAPTTSTDTPNLEHGDLLFQVAELFACYPQRRTRK